MILFYEGLSIHKKILNVFDNKILNVLELVNFSLFITYNYMSFYIILYKLIS